jgi:hypothetical protein
MVQAVIFTASPPVTAPEVLASTTAVAVGVGAVAAGLAVSGAFAGATGCCTGVVVQDIASTMSTLNAHVAGARCRIFFPHFLGSRGRGNMGKFSRTERPPYPW